MPPALPHEEKGFMAKWFLEVIEQDTGVRPDFLGLIREEGGNRLELGDFSNHVRWEDIDCEEIDPREIEYGGNGTPTVKELNDAYAQADYLLPDLVKRGLVLELDEKVKLFSSLFSDWLLMEISSVTEEDPDDESIAAWVEKTADLDKTTWDKMKGALPKFKKSYWTLIGDFTIEVGTKVATEFVLKMAGLA